MKQNYIVSIINGEKVFTSARTGKRLTGAAKIACERTEERKAELAREQAYLNEIVENALILSWYEENEIEIIAEQRRNQAIAKSLTDASEAKKEEVKAAESYEEFCDALEKACEEYDRKQRSEKKNLIAISGWALTEFVIRKLESAFEDEDVKAMYYGMKVMRKRTALFVQNALACMGWKYNASRGANKGAVIEFLKKRNDEKFPLFYGERYDVWSVFDVMGAVIRCMRYAKERSANAVVIKKEIRASLARLCKKMIEGIREAEREEKIE